MLGQCPIGQSNDSAIVEGKGTWGVAPQGW